MPIIEFDTKMRGYDPQQVNDAVTNFQATNPNEADLEDDRTIAFAQIRAKNTASAPATPVDAQ